jgi:hypothetical protein
MDFAIDHVKPMDTHVYSCESESGVIEKYILELA